MGKYKAMTKTVKKFKVKASRKKLEKAERAKNRRQKERMDGMEIETVDVEDGAAPEHRQMGEIGEEPMEAEGKEKAKGLAKRNESRLRKSELPFVGTESGRKGAEKRKSLSKTSMASVDQPMGVTSKKQLTKKKARKMMRNVNREQRKKERTMNAMEVA
ncbi:hypothetical protein GPALN_003702 [Globodera pallida]|nr:hypothetical protein GPALN_003702 [Globodera pallida]